jgi:hypothetical protein
MSGIRFSDCFPPGKFFNIRKAQGGTANTKALVCSQNFLRAGKGFFLAGKIVYE